MSEMFQSSCSELLVDTAIYDPKIAYERFKQLFDEVGWETSPPLSIELLEQIKGDGSADNDSNDVTVYDSCGNYAYIKFGENGYITTGYRFDSGCNDGNNVHFPIFKLAIERLAGEMIACDGGSDYSYREWLR